jgi:hypothetical protein
MCQPSKTHRANTQDRMSDSSSKKPSLHPASPACSARSQPRRWRFKLFAAVFLTAVFRFSSLFEKVFHKSSQPYYFQKLLIMRHTRNISRQLCSCRWQTKRNLIRTIRSGSKAHRQHQANLIMAAVDRQAGGPGNRRRRRRRSMDKHRSDPAHFKQHTFFHAREEQHANVDI